MKRFFLTAVLLSVVFFAQGQGCSICTKTAGDLDGKSAKGLNTGILYLAAFPLALLGTIGYIWWKSNKPTTNEQ